MQDLELTESEEAFMDGHLLPESDNATMNGGTISESSAPIVNPVVHPRATEFAEVSKQLFNAAHIMVYDCLRYKTDLISR